MNTRIDELLASVENAKITHQLVENVNNENYLDHEFRDSTNNSQTICKKCKLRKSFVKAYRIYCGEL